MSISLKELNKNKGIAEELTKLISSGHGSHAFLFAGGSHDDRDEIGAAFSAALLERAEDYLEISKPDDRATIGTASISELQKKLMLTPFGSGYVVLIKDAELMTLEAQNKLLKTLEEPENATLILLSDRKEAMLPTVLSRCQIYILEEAERCYDRELEKIACELEDAMRTNKPYYVRKRILESFLEKKEDQRLKALELLEILSEKILDSVKQGNSQLISAADAVLTAAKYIRQGHNVAYTLKQMCLSSAGTEVNIW